MKPAKKQKPTGGEGPDDLLAVLESRFQSHARRHRGITWPEVLARLLQSPEKLAALAAMESSGGEPDVTGRDAGSDAIVFTDCSAETPKGRVSLCYDEAALDARKEHKPAGSARQMAATMGVHLLTEEQYIALQELGDFDTKTSSWLLTPGELRDRGGALFGDRRYGRVFIYHNGAQSYFGARGFRARLVV